MAASTSHAAAPSQYLPPTLALSFAGLLLALSLVLPYWELTLHTSPQTREVTVVSYLGRLEGDTGALAASASTASGAALVAASELERSLGVAGGAVIGLLAVAAAFVRNRWAALLALPSILFPAIVVADSRRWLLLLCEELGSAPPAAAGGWLPLGRVTAGAVAVEVRACSGLLLALAASLAVIAGLWLHRRAYRPKH